ncbi:hypothetical protein ACFL0N_01415, partial [Pseudomonadota bacterium]
RYGELAKLLGAEAMAQAALLAEYAQMLSDYGLTRVTAAAVHGRVINMRNTTSNTPHPRNQSPDCTWTFCQR